MRFKTLITCFLVLTISTAFPILLPKSKSGSSRKISESIHSGKHISTPTSLDSEDPFGTEEPETKRKRAVSEEFLAEFTPKVSNFFSPALGSKWESYGVAHIPFETGLGRSPPL